MPDKFICDCGFSSETFAENCPMCGALMMTIDGEFEDPDDAANDKYDEEDSEDEAPSVAHRKAA